MPGLPKAEGACVGVMKITGEFTLSFESGEVLKIRVVLLQKRGLFKRQTARSRLEEMFGSLQRVLIVSFRH